MFNDILSVLFLILIFLIEKVVYYVAEEDNLAKKVGLSHHIRYRLWRIGYSLPSFEIGVLNQGITSFFSNCIYSSKRKINLSLAGIGK